MDPRKICEHLFMEVIHMSIFRGSGVAIVTPMKENGEVNYDAYEALLEDTMSISKSLSSRSMS